MNRVRPGVLLTNAILRPVSALMALDLPEFDRPAKAISPALAGTCSSSAALLKNAALRKSDIDRGISLLEYEPFERRFTGGKLHETSFGAFGFWDLRRLPSFSCRRRRARQSRSRQGPEHRQQGLRGVPRRRRQQSDPRQSKARRSDSGIPAEAARQFQAGIRKKG